MRSTRKRTKKDRTQRAALIAVAVGVVVVGFALATLLFGGSDATARADVPPVAPTLGAPLSVEPEAATATPTTPAPSSTPTLTDPGASPDSAGAGIDDLPGLSGEGAIVGIPTHKVVLRMTSSAPIPYVGYIVPTNQKDTIGTVKNPGTSWSKTTFAYGEPDYAQLFSLSNPQGDPITCTITVDGRVTEKRTTTGPYDRMYCQG